MVMIKQLDDSMDKLSLVVATLEKLVSDYAIIKHCDPQSLLELQQGLKVCYQALSTGELILQTNTGNAGEVLATSSTLEQWCAYKIKDLTGGG